ncbi:S-adenosyl-methionine-sterol-C-methyltransferase [Colletotrichum sojae]|uniref:S-adenosyl-methionine-sterol-C-methyltransferase n=1 Tax=Colletotrichum sojae TaxID=2175907 RepID=A0A8H6J5I1_9PEZI|nr:S-adenosyl-methionine-sterol-C-methyltransferase [Colletotrichum sojae]
MMSAPPAPAQPPPPAARETTATPRTSSTSSDVAAAKPTSVAAPRKQTRKPKPSRTKASAKRSTTFWRSFKYLLDLTPKQVDDFMASYVIYNLDWADEVGMRATLGETYAEKVGDCLRAYYGVLNHLCALGEVEKMYIPPLMDPGNLSVTENQLLYEESIANDLGLKKGDCVLDLGCGRGRVAAHVAQVSEARVTGLNIDPDQVQQAREFDEERGIGNEFVVRDMNALPLPFEDSSMDGFYEIQALSLCRDIPALFAEIHRILRPGARLSLLDWVRLPAYDPSNEKHAELMRRTKPLIGAVGTPSPKELEAALRKAGFVVERSDNASVGGLQAPLIEEADGWFRGLRKVVGGLVRCRVLPAHLKTLVDRLCLDGQAFVEMDRGGLVSTSWRIVARRA